MACFLRQTLRAELIKNLLELTMSLELAERLASFGDDLVHLDRTLKRLVQSIGERVQEVREATLTGNEEKRMDADTFLRSDLLIYIAYRTEIVERRLPPILFPRTARAVKGRAEAGEDSQKVMGTVH